MFFTNLLDHGEKIYLPAIMICHIARIANMSKDHDMGYGFLLASVFEELGIPLLKREWVFRLVRKLKAVP